MIKKGGLPGQGEWGRAPGFSRFVFSILSCLSPRRACITGGGQAGTYNSERGQPWFLTKLWSQEHEVCFFLTILLPLGPEGRNSGRKYTAHLESKTPKDQGGGATPGNHKVLGRLQRGGNLLNLCMNSRVCPELPVCRKNPEQCRQCLIPNPEPKGFENWAKRPLCRFQTGTRVATGRTDLMNNTVNFLKTERILEPQNLQKLCQNLQPVIAY